MKELKKWQERIIAILALIFIFVAMTYLGMLLFTATGPEEPEPIEAPVATTEISEAEHIIVGKSEITDAKISVSGNYTKEYVASESFRFAGREPHEPINAVEMAVLMDGHIQLSVPMPPYAIPGSWDDFIQVPFKIDIRNDEMELISTITFDVEDKKDWQFLGDCRIFTIWIDDFEALKMTIPIKLLMDGRDK